LTPISTIRRETMEIQVDDDVIMPDPENDDNWEVGGFVATVVSIDDSTNLATVIDQEDQAWDVETNRLSKITQ
jgi:hypothetical protein